MFSNVCIPTGLVSTLSVLTDLLVVSAKFQFGQRGSVAILPRLPSNAIPSSNVTYVCSDDMAINIRILTTHISL